MLPYQAVAMDYAGYQRQSSSVPTGPMAMGSLGMGGSPFGHSWLVPTQDLCAVPYKQMPNQHQNGGMHPNQQSLEPGILELRKEKSRDAARSRRGKENYEFYELAKMLPLPAAITSQLDKASIIRLTISYLKLRDFSSHGDPPWTRDSSTNSKVLKMFSCRFSGAAIRRSPAVELFEQHQGTHILQSLDGFALAVAADGRFLYISETVSIYLGLSQVEMTGSSIFDYIHQADHAEIAEQLGLSLTSGGSGSNGAGLASPSSGASDEGGGNHGTNNPDVSAQMCINSTTMYKGFERSFCVRMKSTLTKRGCHFKSSGYRVVLLLCKLRPQYTFSHTRKSQPPLLGMVALAIALPPPSVHEIRLECDMFVTRINFDFRIAHCEPRVSDLLDYSPEELVGKNLYNLIHGEDANKMRKSHMDLIEKGQVLSPYYRMMNKTGGYTWLQTCATVVCSTKNADEQNIICVNYVISCRENEHLILDTCQLEPSADSVKNEESGTDKGAGSPGGDPSTEGHPGSASDSKTSSSPKTDNDSHHRTRARSSTTNVNNTSISMAKDASTVVAGTSLGEESIPTALTPNTVTAPTKRGQKRKIKVEEEIVSNNETAISSPDQRETPRSRHPSVIEEHAETSVKDLENAMSKHLPSPGGSSATTDFSADALLKQQQQQQQQQEKSSTIQWIGTPHYQQPPPMPASTLLRQLYANRESVIRATARQTPTGVFYSDNQGGPLPTPPGSESSYDNQYLLHGHTPQKSTDAFTNLVSTYGGYHSSIDYHNAMTPPSSVSPRDSNNLGGKNSSHGSNGGYEYADPLRGGQYNTPTSTDSSSAPPLPLKPQPYSAAAAAMHHHAANTIDPASAYGNLEQPQYFSPHSGFHLYHKGGPSTSWYTAPS
ncbi:protein trachealess isoform X1 [Episyrphus balteatus]|uniref:protein trachealess isoform X1 n=1 Tax=Episyrphus balteatus TaxID=286459 RepID=UPI00248549E9|nr:protein trachealess isoform X1 [Episyrphus balteatus]